MNTTGNVVVTGLLGATNIGIGATGIAFILQCDKYEEFTGRFVPDMGGYRVKKKEGIKLPFSSVH